MSAIKAIHAMRRELKMDETVYRSMLDRVTGKASLTLMSAGELNAVAAEMKRKGAKGKKRLDGDFGPKLQALWISGWNLGVIRNRGDAALLDWVKDQTGIEHTRFLRNAADARKAVEALKKWLTRAAGVDWSAHADPQDCVLAAQLRLLGSTGEAIGYTASGVTSAEGAAAVEEIAKTAMMQLLGERIRARATGV